METSNDSDLGFSVKGRSMSLPAAFHRLAVSVAACSTALASELPVGFVDEKVIGGLRSPASMEFAPDGRLFLGERIDGRLRVAAPNPQSGAYNLEPEPFFTFDIPKDGSGEPDEHRSSGLRDFAFDPDHGNTGYIYALYMKDNPRHNRLVRITRSANDPNVADPGSEVLLLDLPFNANGSSGSHNGCAVAFGGDGMLYATTGDGWVGGDAVQSLSTFTGKIVRIHGDGSIPSDNPFFSQATGDHRAIYALGLRNPYAVTVHDETGYVYVSEANGASKASVLIAEAGANYGHQGYGGIGVETAAWANASTAGGKLVTGGAWYPSSGPFPAEYHGQLFVALWGSNGSNGGPPGDLVTLPPTGSPAPALFADDVGGVDAAGLTLKPVVPRVGPDGHLYYLLTSYETDDGEVRRIRYTGQPSAATPTITPNGGTFPGPVVVTLTTTTTGATVHYTTDASEPDESSPTYSAPLTLALSATLKARAFHPSLAPSGVASAGFVIGTGENVPPVAEAGPDQVVEVLSFVTLNGGASGDPDGDDLLLSDSWVQVGGPPVVLGNADETAAWFMPPVPGVYTFRYTVDDGEDVDLDDTSITAVPCYDDVLDGLVARWSLDEEAGSVALDLAGGLANGVLDGATWTTSTPDGSASALQFDGVDDRVTVDGLDVGGQGFTVCAWLYIDDFDQMDGRVVSKATGLSDAEHLWMLSTIATGGEHRLRFRMRAGGVTSTLIASDGGLPVGEWVHAAATYDGAAMRVYLDGDLVGVLPKSGPIATDPLVGTCLGNQPAGAGSRPFDGTIDDARIYSRALDRVELRVVMKSLAERLCVPDVAPTRGL